MLIRLISWFMFTCCAVLITYEWNLGIWEAALLGFLAGITSQLVASYISEE